MTKLYKLLGTRNKREQEEIVQSLLKAVGTPVIDLVIRFNPSSGDTEVIIVGGSIDFDVAYRILDLARQVFQQREVQAQLAQKLADNDETSPKETQHG